MTLSQPLDRRLKGLPPKVAQPFRQLLASEYLSEDTLTTLLDAGELAGDASKLVGFAVAFLQLRAQHVPVAEVIRLAKTLRRPVNLAWSAKRWTAEYDRLSRAEVLHRLGQDADPYDLSAFEAHLPDAFPGYLIRTPRRLAMEGLRQQHCVASYHSRVRQGAVAIAAVFLDRTRWTVELALTGRPESPLRIAQVKTRRNGPASSEVLAEIHRLLRIAPDLPAPPPETELRHNHLDTLRRVLPVLADHAVETVTVSFEGSCYHGAIDTITYAPDPTGNAGSLPVAYENVVRRFADGRWAAHREPVEGELTEAIEHLTYEYLEEADVDWVNGDGGFGELVIDVARRTVSLDIHVRHTESYCEFADERDIATGDPV